MIENPNKSKSSRIINFAVIICSSFLYQRFKENDQFTVESFDIISGLVNRMGYRIVSKHFVPDDRVMLTKQVGKEISSNIVDAIIVCGGTGLSVSEITLEALRPIMVKTMPGFAEIFRKLSYEQVGSTAIRIRALAGLTDQKKLLFCLPNSPALLKLAMEKLILPEIRSIIYHA